VSVITALVLRPGRGRHAGPFVRDGETPAVPHPVTREAVRANLQDRRELTAQAGVPTTVIPALRLPAGQPSGVIPFAPLTERPAIYDALGGDTRTARSCYCGALNARGDCSWREDALCRWSCPSCQARPEWRAPSLPSVRSATRQVDPEVFGGPEARLIAHVRLATDPRGVRQGPDGRWRAAIPVGGKQKVLGSFGSKEEAEAVYGAMLNAFAAEMSVTA
jgi:hypothetical protein